MEEYGYNKPNAMSAAALILGIAACVSICFYSAIPVGALGIIFALLSRREKMNTQARIGFGLSVSAIVIFAAVVSTALYILVSTGVWNSMMKKAASLDLSDPNAVAELQGEFQDELLAKLTGKSPESASSGGASSAAGDSVSEGISENADPADNKKTVSYHPVDYQNGKTNIKVNIPVAHTDRIPAF